LTLGAFALVILVGMVGPLFAAPDRLRIPVVVGEILAGVAVGRTGAGWVHADDPVLTFLATAGFALVMLLAGSHVPVKDPRLRSQLGRGTLLAVGTGLLAVPAGLGIAAFAGNQHGLLYAVLLASSSAALVMPVIDGAGLSGPEVTATLVHVAVADTVCIVALPLVEDPSRAAAAALGALAVIGTGGLMVLITSGLARSPGWRRLQKFSKKRHFGLELRWNLILLFALAGLAQAVGVSVMLAGFVAGLGLATQGQPRRLARQLFAVSDGFLSPIFFVWLGAGLDLRVLADHPRMVVVAGVLALVTAVIHSCARLVGQPLPLAVLAGAQLGVPVAAVAIGTRSGLLLPGEGGALVLAALVSVAVTAVAAGAAARMRSPGETAGEDTPGTTRSPV
jgi:Kef-type K+ transport system membrane component KefB